MDNEKNEAVESEELKKDADNASLTEVRPKAQRKRKPRATVTTKGTNVATESYENEIPKPTADEGGSEVVYEEKNLAENAVDTVDTELNEEEDAPTTADAAENDDIPQTSLDELAYDKESCVRREDEDIEARFDDFLASYKQQVADMLKLAVQTSSDDETEQPPVQNGEKTTDDAENDSVDYKLHFPTLNYDVIADEDDAEDAVQLTIDIDTPPFSPLKESEKKEKKAEKKYAYNPDKPGFINSLFDILEIFVFTVAIVLFITSFFFRHSTVEGGSMDNTLFDGEHLIISSLFYTPERGDIVVFEDYSLAKKIPIVKRIIGIEGDTVKVENENGVAIVYLNGERLDENYAYTDDFDMNPTGEWTVGEGEVFVLGDHRNISWDSRSFGTVSVDSILGKATLRFYPFDRFGFLD